MSAGQPDATCKIREKYAPLIKSLEPRMNYEDNNGNSIRYAEFEVIIGSAMNPPTQLINKLYQHSVERKS